jgi:hypothetical protein
MPGLPVIFVFNPDGSFFVPAPFIIPLTTAPRQTINVTLGGQVCTIRIYTKSINVPITPPGSIPTAPPTYRNINPVFLDLYLGTALVAGGCICLNNVPIIRAPYSAFIGDLILTDTQLSEDAQGVPTVLPPLDLRNDEQRAYPLYLEGRSPTAIAGIIPGLGTRFLLQYWAFLP